MLSFNAVLSKGKKRKKKEKRKRKKIKKKKEKRKRREKKENKEKRRKENVMLSWTGYHWTDWNRVQELPTPSSRCVFSSEEISAGATSSLASLFS